MKKMTVCFFCTEGLPAIYSQQYSLQDINILNSLGYRVVIATNFSEVPYGCDFYFSWWASGSIIPMVKAKLSNKPIIVIAGGNEAMLYVDSVTKVPHGYLAAPLYKKIATQITLRLATKVLVVSKFMREGVKGLGCRKAIYIPNSVDTANFTGGSLEREYVMTVFNLDRQPFVLKRGEVFIRSIPYILEKFPSQQFLIIGKWGDQVESIRTLIDNLGISKNVILKGAIENSQMVKWLQRSKVYVQISDTETFGLTVAEAMSCETPVVISRRGALPELVGEVGTFVDHNDSRSVAEGIIEILSLDSKIRNEVGAKSRMRIIENFDYHFRKAKLETIIKEILKLK